MSLLYWAVLQVGASCYRPNFNVMTRYTRKCMDTDNSHFDQRCAAAPPSVHKHCVNHRNPNSV